MISFNGSSLVKTLTKQVFAFSGPVDHLLNMEFSCAINQNSIYSGTGLESAHISGASSKGIYYNCIYEGWHGDKPSTLYMSPFNIADFGSVSNINLQITLSDGRNQSSGVSILQYPSASNNYRGKIQVYDPSSGESNYTLALNMTIQTTGKVFFNGVRMNRVFFNGTQVY